MCWWRPKFIVGLMLTLGLISCAEDRVFLPGQDGLFSTGHWIDSMYLAGGLDSIQSRVIKSIQFNGNPPEAQSIVSYNIKSDLAVLYEYDFSSIRWKDSYQKTIRDSSDWTIVEYRADHEKAPVQFFQGQYNDQGQLENLKLLRRSETMVSKNKYSLILDIKEGYEIKQESQLLFRNPATFVSEVKFEE